MAQTTYLTTDELARRLGVSERTLFRRLQEIPTYSNPADRRRILIAAEDAERLGEPTPRVHGRAQASSG